MRPHVCKIADSAAPANRRSASRAGRIPAASLAAHDAALLAVARKMFCEVGYEKTTLHAIAREARVSPKTIYARYGSKEGIFDASVQVRANDIVAPLRAPLTKREDVYASLYAFAMRLLTVTSAREAVLMQRLVIAEGQRFPEIGKRFMNAGPRHGAKMVASLLKMATESRYLYVPCPDLAGEMFIGALLGVPGRLALIPTTSWYSPHQRRKRADAAVRLFIGAFSVNDDGTAPRS